MILKSLALLSMINICQAGKSTINQMHKRPITDSIFNLKSVEEHQAGYTGPAPLNFTVELNHFNATISLMDPPDPFSIHSFDIRYIIDEQYN